MANTTVNVFVEENGCEESEERDLKVHQEEQEPDSSVKTEELLSNNSTPTKKKEPSNKITIKLHPIANAPILKNRKWLVEPSQNMGYLSCKLRKFLKLTAAESLFLYVDQAFSPALDQIFSNLLECHGVDGILNIHYCTTQAWG